MKKSSIISVIVAVAIITANSALAAFAFSDKTPNITATIHQQQEANISPEEQELLADAQKSADKDMKIYTMIASDSIMEKPAIQIAKRAVSEKFGVNLNNYNAITLLTGTEDSEVPNWFISFTSKNVETDNAPIYIVCVDSKTGDVISAKAN